MILTKFPHACLRLEKDGAVLVVDPGTYSSPAEALAGADAVLITHEHADHVDVDALRAAAQARPGLTVHAHPDVVAQLGDVPAEKTGVTPGDAVEVAGFAVRVFGGRHAHVHEDVPDIPNNGYLIDDRLYYGGDSFDVPDAEVHTLLVPVGAPWLKIAEAIDYLRAVGPRRAHPTHDFVLSEAGQGMADTWLRNRGGGAEVVRLTRDNPIEV